MSHLTVKGLFYRYPARTKDDSLEWALRDVSLDVSKGEFVVIVGPSGSGKTTLLKNIAGILRPTRGKIFLEGEDITNLPLERRNVGYVPQNQALFPHLTVRENIEFGLKARKWARQAREQRVRELASLGGIKHHLDRKPRQLSGGQQQRVALLRALAPYPKILLLDEPLSNLDAQLRENLAFYIKDIQREFGITTIMVTHDLNEAKILADTIVIMNEGRVLQEGSPIEVTLYPNSLTVVKILDFKNVYPVLDVVKCVKERKFLVKVTFGTLFLPLDTFENKGQLSNQLRPRAIHVKPSLVTLVRKSDQNINKKNHFLARVLANIVDVNTNMVILLLKLHDSLISSERELLEPFSRENHHETLPSVTDYMMRIQLPLTINYPKVDEEVVIQVPPSSLSFYY